MGDVGDREQPGETAGDELRQDEASRREPRTTATDSARQPLSPGQIDAIRDAFVGDDPDASRFSLWGLFGIVSAASLILAAGTYFPKSVFAGAVGVATLVSLVALSAMKHPPGILRVGWWVLLLIYLMAIFSAVLG